MNKKTIDSRTKAGVDDDGYTSKTAIKKAMRDLQALGEQLLELPASKLDQLTLSGPLLEALTTAKKIKVGNARRRQIHYIGKLMRAEDIDHIKAVLEGFKREDRSVQKTIDTTQNWLQSLVADKQALAEFIRSYPNSDRQKMAQLLRQVQQQPVNLKDKHTKSQRQLFTLIQETIKQHQTPE